MAEITVSVDAVEVIETQIVEVVQQTEIETVEIGLQGPRGVPGPKGDPGPIGDAGGALLVNNRLNEFDTAQARMDARMNLELQHIDCGEYL